MSSIDSQPQPREADLDGDSLVSSPATSPLRVLMQQVLAPVASLKLTVVLLLLGIFIVFVGTLAQVDRDIWEVINEYFRTTNGEFFVWIKPSLFFPPAFFPEGAPQFQDWAGFWFPKGWLIGFAMLANLFAAHLVRFKVQASGPRLGGGVLVTLLGVFVTTLVILYGAGATNTQGYRHLWQGLSLSLLLLAGVSTFAAVFTEPNKELRRWMFGLLAACLGGAALWGLQNEPFNPDAMRIMYQLVLATGVSLVSLVGCLMVFKNRGGIVLIHAGIGLMMAHEILVGIEHVESRMQIEEGETATYSSDIRTPELAIIDTSDAKEDVVTVIPGTRLEIKREGETSKPISEEITDSLLPFKVIVRDYYPNTMLRARKSLTAEDKAPENLATQGIGDTFSILPVQKVAGTDSGGMVDIPGGYFEIQKPDGESLGTWLLSADLGREQSLTYDGKEYLVALRFQRIYHPFQIRLKDVQKNDYKGTNNPRDYSSFVDVKAEGGNFEQRIWMNNPMRYAGMTFYQSSYVPAGAMGTGSREATVLQVVSNQGWMAPYVACMMVVVGMLAHFGVTLLRFLDRAQRRRQEQPTVAVQSSYRFLDVELNPRSGGLRGLAIGLLLFLVVWGYTYSKSRAPKVKENEPNIAAFGELPMWYKGRAMPIDTFARSALLQLSDRESYRPPSTGWIVEVRGQNAAKLFEFNAAFRKFVESIDYTVSPPAYTLPDGWKMHVAEPAADSGVDGKEQESDPRLLAEIDVPVGEQTLTLSIRRTVMDVADYEGFTQTQIDKWRKSVGIDPIDGYGWRKHMRDKQELQEFKLHKNQWLGQVLLVPGKKESVLAGLVTPAKGEKSRGATEWLLTLMSDEETARELPVIRIENSDVASTLGLDTHRHGLTYSMAELQENFDALAKEAEAAGKVDSKARNLRQKKVVELANKVILYRFLELTLGRPPLLPNREEFGANDPAQRRVLIDRFAGVNRQSVEEFAEQNRSGPLPLMVPAHIGLKVGDDTPQSIKKDWEVLSTSRIHGQFLSEQKSTSGPAITLFQSLLDAAQDRDGTAFNKSLTAYQDLLQKHYAAVQEDSQKARDDLPLEHVLAEAKFNRSELFFLIGWCYVISLVVAFVGWLFAPEFNQRLSFALSVGLLCLYTYALYMRMYISGRPPVTNLYSSAIFIGWATVLGGLIMESYSWRGFGNVVAAATGFAALRIADGLAADGDTIAVMEAVLDTQFWLATHVVCITLGYATTFLAGFLGLLYLIRGIATPVSKEDLDDVTRMMYGTLCFATFFSFFGTVLGGLWADDSWGRFWGWDPKENGALIIVLWNAVILHARWGAMIKARGLAILTVLGNVVVSWSWFGVNELGVGLHSYGFTEGRLKWLAIFAVSQVICAVLGLIPKSLWASSANKSLSPGITPE